MANIKGIQERLAEEARQEMSSAVSAACANFYRALDQAGIEWPKSFDVTGFTMLDNEGKAYSKTLNPGTYLDKMSAQMIETNLPKAIERKSSAFILRVEELANQVDALREQIGQ